MLSKDYILVVSDLFDGNFKYELWYRYTKEDAKLIDTFYDNDMAMAALRQYRYGYRINDNEPK